MSMAERWNSIVLDVQTHIGDREEAVQRLWEDIFADSYVFGYSKRSKEIDIWRNLPVGSRERTIPDIIIRDSIKNKDLFVVELKQHNMCFHQKYKDQLVSYMKLLELKVGLLICDKLYIIYREPRDNDSTEYLLEIPFEKDNAQGKKFIELFTKGEFEEKKVKDYIFEQDKRKRMIEEIKNDIQHIDIKDLIKNYYYIKNKGCGLEELDVEQIVEEILQNIDIVVRPKMIIMPEFSLQPPISTPIPKIDKEEAIKLFANRGYILQSRKTTFASKNKSELAYWANPNISMLREDWNIILNDWERRKLFLFFIPRDTVNLYQLVTRNDQPDKIDLQIKYNDYSFTDLRSGMKFRQYLKGDLSY